MDFLLQHRQPTVCLSSIFEHLCTQFLELCTLHKRLLNFPDQFLQAQGGQLFCAAWRTRPIRARLSGFLASSMRLTMTIRSRHTPTFFPGPSRPSTVFVQIILPSKWTGVSLKVSRRNWQESGPGEEKVHQLFKTNYNRWHFRWLLKDVQQSIIQLYLPKVTL